MQSDSPAAAPLPSWFGGRARLLALAARRDARGTLQPLDPETLPFAPKRLFFVRDVPAGSRRGGHAHRSARQLLVCVHGAVDIELRVAGDGSPALTIARLRLDRADVALLVEPGVWIASEWSAADAVLLVLGSEAFDPASFSDVPLD